MRCTQVYFVKTMANLEPIERATAYFRAVTYHGVVGVCLVGMIGASCGRSPEVATRSAHLEQPRLAEDPQAITPLAISRLRALDAMITIRRDVSGRDRVEVDLTLVDDISGALQAVSELPGVERLNLHAVNLQPEDRRLLQGLRGLRWMDLSQTDITNDDLALLEHNRDLEFLILWGTNIDDRGLVAIGQLDHLRKLDLSATRITGDGIARFPMLTSLMELYVEVPGISEAAVESLRRQLPHTMIAN